MIYAKNMQFARPGANRLYHEAVANRVKQDKSDEDSKHAKVLKN